jgi:lysophospholipase L1-like esterase
VNTHHFTKWGYQAFQAKSAIAAQISTHQPDYLLIVLGFNDLGWFVNGPDGLLADMKALVDDVRSMKADVKFAIADVPQRKRLEGRQDLIEGTEEYNGKLAEAIPSWDSEESTVRLVGLCENYECKSHMIYITRVYHRHCRPVMNEKTNLYRWP